MRNIYIWLALLTIVEIVLGIVLYYNPTSVNTIFAMIVLPTGTVFGLLILMSESVFDNG